MDPVTIISLGGACSGLVNKCGSVVKTLHNLIEAYKYADLSIMSLSEECANIQFAYSHVEQWASQDPTGSHNLGPFLNRLQQTMQSGQLVFSALEEDLKRLVPKTSSLRRRATLVWHEALFDSHRIRLRGQAASLHLLLTVISMRLDDDSLKVLQTQEHIFKDADESARSITPSQMSTHRIITGDDSASVIDPDSCWQPFMFDKELFASHVYQRSYRQVVIDRSMHSTAVKRPKSVASISTVFHVHPGTRLSGRWSLGQHSVRSFRMNKSHSTGSSLRRHSASESEKTQAELLLDETRSGSIQGSSDGRVANMTTSGNSTQPIDYPFRTPMDEATWEVYLNFENMVSSMTALLSSNVKPTKSSLTTALRALVSRMLSITNMPTIVACGSPPSKPTTCRAVSMVTTLLSQGADSSATVVRGVESSSSQVLSFMAPMSIALVIYRIQKAAVPVRRSPPWHLLRWKVVAPRSSSYWTMAPGSSGRTP
ncbi:hypothetical protein K491DRAFT_677641 [Lophiostoma macrostomum CBS 122681]|uniref:Fungal N-terminal domain-containing protein n=1 Tax=Lophiostoma macrostomum CBS 122681 TaxID=1314788 RepID=A0A6A6TB58_9PLEO|nr:hypothetical protein K491DRAFT_677641 [Lophiostoma macrostomum CBS 122681]